MRGVTLMELLTVVMIVGILAAVAVPSYRSYVVRAQRTDATAALLRVAAAQEKFYLQNNRYATNAELAVAPPGGLGIPSTERGFYQLSTASTNSAVDFTATAQPIAGGAQASDTRCATFTINEQGRRTAQTSAAADNTTLCWK